MLIVSLTGVVFTAAEEVTVVIITCSDCFTAGVLTVGGR